MLLNPLAENSCSHAHEGENHEEGAVSREVEIDLKRRSILAEISQVIESINEVILELQYEAFET